MSKIITIFNQKGGCGKSTLTMQISGTLGLRDYKVLIVDLDPQGTSTVWHKQAESIAHPKFPKFPADIIQSSPDGNGLVDEIQSRFDQYDYIVIDCPPSVDEGGCNDAILLSDLVLMPMIPSPSDIWSSETAILLIEEAIKRNPELSVFIVPTRVKSNSAMANTMVEHIAESIQFPLTRTSVGERTAFLESALIGGTVHRITGSKKAVQEVDALVNEIIRILKKRSK